MRTPSAVSEPKRRNLLARFLHQVGQGETAGDVRRDHRLDLYFFGGLCRCAGAAIPMIKSASD